MKTSLPEAVIEKIQTTIMKQLDVARDQVQPEADLKIDLGADSLDMVEISMSLEEQLGLSVPDDDLEGVETVGDLYEVARKHLNSGACEQRGDARTA